MTLVIPASSPSEWIEALPDTEKRLIKELLATGMSEENVAAFWLGRGGSDSTLGFSSGGQAKNYLASVTEEFRKLICGGNGYDELRQQFSTIWKQGKTAVIGAVAAAVTSVTNIAIGVVSPVIALLFAMICKVSVNAWCALK